MRNSTNWLSLIFLLLVGCARSVCGDGTLSVGEICDDGNVRSGDGCRQDCLKVEICGDGLFDEGEACDDGNAMAGDTCSPDCKRVQVEKPPTPIASVEPQPTKQKPTPTPTITPTPKPAPKSVQEIDWYNRVYMISSDDCFDQKDLIEGYGNCHMPTGCSTELEEISFTDGTSTQVFPDRDLSVRAVAFGDLTGDGVDEAVVLFSAGWGGALDPDFDEGYIAQSFKLSGGKVVFLGTLKIGSSKVSRGVSLSISGGKVYIKRKQKLMGEVWFFDGNSMRQD